jgi:hypothetical protein
VDLTYLLDYFMCRFNFNTDFIWKGQRKCATVVVSSVGASGHGSKFVELPWGAGRSTRFMLPALLPEDKVREAVGALWPDQQIFTEAPTKGVVIAQDSFSTVKNPCSFQTVELSTFTYTVNDGTSHRILEPSGHIEVVDSGLEDDGVEDSEVEDSEVELLTSSTLVYISSQPEFSSKEDQPSLGRTW